MSGCKEFKENTWRRDLCGDCLRPRGTHNSSIPEPSSKTPAQLDTCDNGDKSLPENPETFALQNGSPHLESASNESLSAVKTTSSPLKHGSSVKIISKSYSDASPNIQTCVKSGLNVSPVKKNLNTASPKKVVRASQSPDKTASPVKSRSGSLTSTVGVKSHRSPSLGEKPALPRKGAHLKNIVIDRSPTRSKSRSRSNSSEPKTPGGGKNLPKKSALRLKSCMIGNLLSVKFNETKVEIIGTDGGLNGSDSEDEEEGTNNDGPATPPVKLTQPEKELAQLTFNHTKFNSNAENLKRDLKSMKDNLESRKLLGSAEILAIEDDMLWHPTSFSSVSKMTDQLRISPPPSVNKLHLEYLNIGDDQKCAEKCEKSKVQFSSTRPQLSAHRFIRKGSSDAGKAVNDDRNRDEEVVYQQYDISVRDRSNERDSPEVSRDEDVLRISEKSIVNMVRPYKVVDITPMPNIVPYKVIDIAENLPEEVQSHAKSDFKSLESAEDPVELSDKKNASFLHTDKSSLPTSVVQDVESALKVLNVSEHQSDKTPCGTITKSSTVERRQPDVKDSFSRRHLVAKSNLQTRRHSYGKCDDSSEDRDFANPVILYDEKEKLRLQCASPRKVPIMIRHHTYEDIDNFSSNREASPENFYDLYDAVSAQHEIDQAKEPNRPLLVSSVDVDKSEKQDDADKPVEKEPMLVLPKAKSVPLNIASKRMTIASSHDLAKTAAKQIKRPAPSPPQRPTSPPPKPPQRQDSAPLPPPTSTLPRPIKKDSTGSLPNFTSTPLKETDDCVDTPCHLKSKSRLSGKNFLKKFLKRGGKEKEYNLDMVGSAEEVASSPDNWTGSVPIFGSDDFDYDDDDDSFDSDSDSEFVEENKAVAEEKSLELQKTPEILNKDKQNERSQKSLSVAFMTSKYRKSSTQKDSRTGKRRMSLTKEDISSPQPLQSVKSTSEKLGETGRSRSRSEESVAKQDKSELSTLDEVDSNGENYLNAKTSVDLAVIIVSPQQTDASKPVKTPPPRPTNPPKLSNSSTLGRNIRKPPAPPPPVPTSRVVSNQIHQELGDMLERKRLDVVKEPTKSLFSTADGEPIPKTSPQPTAAGRKNRRSSADNSKPPVRPPPPARVSSVDQHANRTLPPFRYHDNAKANRVDKDNEKTRLSSPTESHTYETLPDEIYDETGDETAVDSMNKRRRTDRIYEPMAFEPDDAQRLAHEKNNCDKEAARTIIDGCTVTVTPTGLIRQHAYEIIGNGNSGMVTSSMEETLNVSSSLKLDNVRFECDGTASNRNSVSGGYLTPIKTSPRQYYNTASLDRKDMTRNNDESSDDSVASKKMQNDHVKAVSQSDGAESHISGSWENLFAVLDVGGAAGSRKISLPSVETDVITKISDIDEKPIEIKSRAASFCATLPHRRPPPRSESLRDKPPVKRYDSALDSHIRTLRSNSMPQGVGTHSVVMRRDSNGDLRRRRNRDSLPEQYVLLYKQHRSNSIDSNKSEGSEYVDMNCGMRGHRLPDGASVTDVQIAHETVSRLNLESLRNMFQDWLKHHSSQQVIESGVCVSWSDFVLESSEFVVSAPFAMYYSAQLRENDETKCTLRVSREHITSDLDEISHPSIVAASQRFEATIPSQFLAACTQSNISNDQNGATSDTCLVTHVFVTILPFDGVSSLSSHLAKLLEENMESYFCEMCNVLLQVLHFSAVLADNNLVFYKLSPDCIILTPDFSVFVDPSHICGVELVDGDDDEAPQIICNEVISLILKLLEVDTFATLNDPLEFLYKKTVFKITQLLNEYTIDCIRKCVETLAFVLWGPSEPLMTVSQAPSMDETGMQLWLDVECARMISKIIRKRNCHTGHFFYRLEFLCGITRTSLVSIYESFLSQIS